ncbi:MAG: phosphoribosylaminoimidazolesuccinocarboxamide synthase [Rickettsiales bacterium]|nr:phosphoribosylaminoimidazolesuccinocarboxamide synthase [Rickettsiales bacterium]|tara:strand:- start:2118 stop:3029 length:912 start_codon:yes stop_codon:yes gene_type:complete
MSEMIYHGKVKQVWTTEDPDIIEFRYTDQISVFDQIIPSTVPHKGESLNRTSCHWFELVEKANICETHIKEMSAPDRVRTRRYDVIREPGAIPKDAENFFVPLEVICRHYLAGSAWRRYKRGEASASEFGFAEGTELKEGMKLPRPYLEVSTKFEKFDRLLDRQEALQISNLRESELDAILEVVVQVDEIIDAEAGKAGLIHVDGKKEFALGAGRKPVLVDSFGTLDEDRWWDADAYGKGEIIQLSKEFVRGHYIETGHHASLEAARKDGSAEPPIPALPQEVIERCSSLYVDMFERLTGRTF